MSVDYTAVLDDLRAKRDAIDNLIAALENVSRLNAPVTIVATRALPRAEKQVGRSVGRYKTRATSREGEAAPEGDSRGDLAA